jgi:hypothetical protein
LGLCRKKTKYLNNNPNKNSQVNSLSEKYHRVKIRSPEAGNIILKVKAKKIMARVLVVGTITPMLINAYYIDRYITIEFGIFIISIFSFNTKTTKPIKITLFFFITILAVINMYNIYINDIAGLRTAIELGFFIIFLGSFGVAKNSKTNESEIIDDYFNIYKLKLGTSPLNTMTIRQRA